MKWGFFMSFIIFVKTKNTIYVQFYSKFHSGWAYRLLILVIAVVNSFN
jgi:hypothetical protein